MTPGSLPVRPSVSSPSTISSPTTRVSIVTWADSFYELTRHLPEACQPDRYFLRKYTQVLLRYDPETATLLPPVLTVDNLDASFITLGKICELAFECGIELNDRNLTGASKSIHAILKRLRKALEFSGLSGIDDPGRGSKGGTRE